MNDFFPSWWLYFLATITNISYFTVEVSFIGTGATVEEGEKVEICVSKLFGTTGNRVELNVGVMASAASSSGMYLQILVYVMCHSKQLLKK